MKTWILSITAAFLAIFIGTSVNAAYVLSSSLNCRAAPNQDSVIVGRFVRGYQLKVLERYEGWGRVEVEGTPPCWVAEMFLSEEPVGEATAQEPPTVDFDTPVASPPRAKASRRATSAPRRTSRRASSSPRASFKAAPISRSPSMGGSCPCTSSRVCTGPRGGRYCLNSTGSKRYGV
jgi:uncharacterized protein YgiM (DUF1202 family)